MYQNLIIRPGKPSDAKQVIQFIKDLATFENEPLSTVKVTEEDILKNAFPASGNGLIGILIAEWKEDEKLVPIGMALYFFNYSTWTGKPGLYLEDLYVDPKYRGKAVGSALLQACAKVAVEKGCPRYQWQVLDWNEPAIKFYESKGGKILKEWLTVRVEGDALLKLGGLETTDAPDVV